MSSPTPRDFVDRNPASPQVSLESVIRLLSPKDKAIFQDPKGNFLPYPQWKGVVLDEKGNIIEIDWNGLFTEEGMLHFLWLPSTLRFFSASKCSLVGFLPLHELPRALEMMSVRGNKLSGRIELNHLPEGIVEVNLGDNAFNGPVEMTHLPHTIEHIVLSGNKLEDPLDLQSLPASLKHLNLDNNMFRERIHIGTLPDVNLSLKGNPIDMKAIVQNSSYENAAVVHYTESYFVDGNGKRLAWIASERKSSSVADVTAELKGDTKIGSVAFPKTLAQRNLRVVAKYASTKATTEERFDGVMDTDGAKEQVVEHTILPTIKENVESKISDEPSKQKGTTFDLSTLRERYGAIDAEEAVYGKEKSSFAKQDLMKKETPKENVIKSFKDNTAHEGVDRMLLTEKNVKEETKSIAKPTQSEENNRKRDRAEISEKHEYKIPPKEDLAGTPKEGKVTETRSTDTKLSHTKSTESKSTQKKAKDMISQEARRKAFLEKEREAIEAQKSLMMSTVIDKSDRSHSTENDHEQPPKKEKDSDAEDPKSDSHKGKKQTDHGLLSQQELMEKVIARLSPKDRAIFQTPDGRYLPVDQWNGVKLDQKGNICSIQWNHLFQEAGELDFQWLPSTIEHISASNCNLKGTLPLEKFPESLEWFFLCQNELSGNINLNDLPKKLVCASFDSNDFHGRLDFTNLPKGMQNIWLQGNRFDGPLDFRNLPKDLHNIDLQGNKFRKDIFIHDVPSTRVHINLNRNPIDMKDIVKNCPVKSARIEKTACGKKVLMVHKGKCLAVIDKGRKGEWNDSI